LFDQVIVERGESARRVKAKDRGTRAFGTEDVDAVEGQIQLVHGHGGFLIFRSSRGSAGGISGDEFEDDGGILPIHTVGVSVTGMIPSGRLGLHYVAEVGNGRASSSPSAEPVQNVVDENNGKSFNLGFYFRPTAIPGLQAGVSLYHDGLRPIASPAISETIVAAHAIIVRPNFEWLNEALVIRHAPDGSRVFDTPGFYTQVSKRFGSYQPYFRYQYVNAADAEPVFPQVGRQQGPSVGVRYDPSDYVALKLQYDHLTLRGQPSTDGLNLQVGFTF
jgi:hypothetical protein